MRSNKRFMYGRDIHFGTNLLLIDLYIAFGYFEHSVFPVTDHFGFFFVLHANDKLEMSSEHRHLQAAIALKSRRAIA